MDTEAMSHLEYKIEELSKKTDRIYDALFGFDGQGGAIRMIEKHDEKLNELQQSKAKAIGVIAALTCLGGAIGAKLSSLWKP